MNFSWLMCLTLGFLQPPCSRSAFYCTDSFHSLRGEGIAAPEWGLTLLGYAIFLWISLEVVTVYAVGADLAVVACYCLSLGILLRLRPDDGMIKFALFGLSLGIGYWTKVHSVPFRLHCFADRLFMETGNEVLEKRHGPR